MSILTNKIHLKYKQLSHKLRQSLTPKIEIPPYEEKRAIIDEYRIKYGLTTLIETGTFLGDTIAHFSGKFTRLISIELSQELAQRAKVRFAADPTVEIMQGDSGEVLKSLVPSLTEPTLFWLDGHYSSKCMIGDELITTAKGTVNTPIEKELQVILQSGIPHCMLIDDARLFNGKDDYPTIKTLRKIISASKLRYKIFLKRDIIFIVP